MPLAIVDEDEISRCIIYARAFKQEAHVDEYLWRFEGTKDDGASHESGVLRRLAPNSADVHRIGCGIAARQNQRLENPAPGPKRRYYCGFKTAVFRDLPKDGDGYRIVITNVPEDGEESHVDVALFIEVEGKSAKATRRLDAGLALAEHFGPAEPHICDCDLKDGEQPLIRLGPNCLGIQDANRWPSLILPQPQNDTDASTEFTGYFLTDNTNIGNNEDR